MSLIRLRRDRRELGHRVKRPPSLAKLIALLLIVGALIWYLGRIA